MLHWHDCDMHRICLSHESGKLTAQPAGTVTRDSMQALPSGMNTQSCTGAGPHASVASAVVL